MPTLAELAGLPPAVIHPGEPPLDGTVCKNGFDEPRFVSFVTVLSPFGPVLGRAILL